MEFTPDEKTKDEIPYYEDLRAQDGWGGMATDKSLATLENEVKQAIVRLGGSVTQFSRGKFGDRPGYRIRYQFTDPEGLPYIRQFDFVSFPVRKTATSRRGSWQSFERRQEASLRTVLYNVRDVLNGMWRLGFMSPGLDPLMPLTLTDSGQTIMEIWNEKHGADRLLTDGAAKDFIEGNMKD